MLIFKDADPPSQFWAPPNKPNGYPRHPAPIELAKKTGRKMARDLIPAGPFMDLDSSSARDQLAGIRVTEDYQGHLERECEIELAEEGSDDEIWQ